MQVFEKAIHMILHRLLQYRRGEMDEWESKSFLQGEALSLLLELMTPLRDMICVLCVTDMRSTVAFISDVFEVLLSLCFRCAILGGPRPRSPCHTPFLSR